MHIRARIRTVAVWAVLATSCLLISAPQIALAGSNAYSTPEYGYTDILGVDIGSSQFQTTNINLSIGGSGPGGLVWRTDAQENGPPYHGRIEFWRYPAATEGELSHVRVNIEGNATFFSGNCVTTGCVNTSGNGATLVQSGAYWVLTDRAGTQFKFDTTASWTQATSTASVVWIGRLISILYPNGALVTINGTHNAGCTISCGFTYNSVVSNQGFAVKYGTPTSGASVVNLLAHSCDAAMNCDSYDGSITSAVAAQISDLSGASYNISKIFDTYGNASGEAIQAINRIDSKNPDAYVRVNAIRYYRSPTGSEIEFTRDTAYRLTTVKDERGTWRYDYNGETLTMAQSPAGWRIITLYDPSNVPVYSVKLDKGTGKIWYVDDALGRRTTYDMQWTSPAPSSELGFFRLGSLTMPEGNKVSYTYDARGNVLSVTNTPKVGSGLAATSITASYPTTCTYPKTCNQPTWTRDAKLNQTDYTYDNNHGGVLTVTLPADQNGLRQRTYNTYTAFDTGNGIVYRLTRSETCGLTSAQLTLTACPTLASTAVKVIDYGTSTTAPKTYKSSLPLTVTQTDGAATLSATTTYAYDNLGNLVSVDGPLAGTVDQRFTTYDANRRKIFEIGPIPGGTGQNRMVVRHWYDADGKEWKTENGYSSTNATDGSGFVVVNFTRVTYDAAGRPGRTEVVQP